MSGNIVIPIIDDALGHSVIYEEHKGNFATARKLAEARLVEASRQGSAAQLAEANLARGVVHILQGEPAAALRCFDQLGQSAADSPARRLQSLAWSNLATYERFLAFPNGGGGSSLDIEARWNSQAFAQDQNQSWIILLGQVSEPAVLLEASLVYKLLVNLYPIRCFMDGLEITSPAEGDRLLSAAMQVCLAFRQQAESLGAGPGLLAYTEYVAADLHRRARRDEIAQQLLAHACATYVQCGDSAGAATCHMTWGDWLAAPYSTPLVWNHAMQEGTQSNELAWPREAAEFDRRGVRPAEAQAAYAEAERHFSVAHAPRGLAAVQLRYAFLAMLGDDYARAADHAAAACRAFEQVGDVLGEQVARAHHALSRVGAGELPEDIATAEAIGTWGRDEGSFSFILGLGRLFARAGRRWLVCQGDFERALACFRLAETLCRKLGAATNEAHCLADQGTACQIVGQQSLALEAYERAWDRFADLMNSQTATALPAWQQAIILGNSIFQIYQGQRDADGMERSTKRLKALFANRPAAGPDLFGARFPDTLNQTVAMQDDYASVLAPLYRATALRDAGDSAGAEQQFELARAAAHRLAGAQRDLQEAIVLGESRQYPQAIEAFQRYLEQGGATTGFAGNLAARMGEIFNAPGLAIARQQQERTHEFAATFFTRVKAYADARRHLDALEQMAGTDWWNRNARPWETLSDYGEVHEGLNELPRALTYYDRAITALEERRGLLSRDELKTALAGARGAQFLYFQAARTAVRLRELAKQRGDADQAADQAARAFDYAQRGKSRALLDLMAAGADLGRSGPVATRTVGAWRQLTARITTRRGLLARERGQPNPVSERIAYLVQQIESDEAELRRLESELASSVPEFHRAINPQAQVMSLDAVCRALPPDTALLEYYFLGDDLLAWAVTRQGIAAVPKASVNAQQLKQQIRMLHRRCEARAPLGEVPAQLAAILLDPLADAINASGHLVVVPYGAAHLLPFHALPWAGQPLVETHSVSYLPTASVLQFLHTATPRAAVENILAVGDPADMSCPSARGGERKSLPPLRAAASEAAYVVSLFPRGNVLLGAQATLDDVRRQITQYSVLHFATHGNLSEEAPLLSSIALAHGQELRLEELMGLRLNAELVVLSACNTGQGETTGGDDVVGFTRGLLAAGARSAVVSLWPVDDVSTSLLMGEFYRRLIAGDTPAVALAMGQNYLRALSPSQIKKALRQLDERLEATGSAVVARHGRPAGATAAPDDYSHPSYWAPFIVVG